MKSYGCRRVGWGLIIVAIFGLFVCGQAGAGTTERVSVSSSGEEAHGRSDEPSLSPDGRYVAFRSDASNLVTGDTNGADDIFVHDRVTGETARVSVSSSGEQGNNYSYEPSLSADGRYVAFNSYASNLVPGDTNENRDVFVHDRVTGQTTPVSVSSSGGQGNGWSGYPSISADGRYVAFHSFASNLVTGDTNGADDIFVHDRVTGQTTRVSVSSSGEQGNDESYWPSISVDGRYVTFGSSGSNLVTNDTNGNGDVFVHDRVSGETARVSVSSSGVEGNNDSWYASLSADGRYAALRSFASNLVTGDTNEADDIFVHDRVTGQTTRVSVSSSGEQGNGYSYTPSISADGRYVAFNSTASNLVPGDTNENRDIFVHDRVTGETARVSVSSTGVQGNNDSWYASLSADGRYVAFWSSGSNLITGDTNGNGDVFIYDRAGDPGWPPNTPSVPATVAINPETLNLKSNGKYVIAYIELPSEYNPTDIDPAVDIVLQPGGLIAKQRPREIGDYDTDGIPDLMVKFDRQALIEALRGGEYAQPIELMVTGQLMDGNAFSGKDSIRIVIGGDTDRDGDVDLVDLGNLAGAYGTTSGATWTMGDFDGDGDVDLVDLGALAGNYGHGVPAPLNFAADAAKLGLSNAKNVSQGQSNSETTKEETDKSVLPLPGGCIPSAIVLMMCLAGGFFWLGSYRRVRS